ncbi:MAG TPA: hypothetical protein VF570_08545, partial [Pyrinomonadaceae bacterium]
MANRKQKGKVFTVAVAVIALALGFLLVAALMRGHGSGGADPRGTADPERAAAQTQQPARDAAPAARAAPGAASNKSPFSQVFGDSNIPEQPTQGGSGDWLMTFATVTVRLTLAALLSAMLAFRPRRL